MLLLGFFSVVLYSMLQFINTQKIMSKANKIVTKLWTFKSILTAVSFHALIAVQLLEWSSSARHSLVSFPVPHLEVQCLTTKLFLLIHKLLQFPGVNQSQSVSNPHQCLIEWKKCLLSPPPTSILLCVAAVS